MKEKPRGALAKHRESKHERPALPEVDDVFAMQDAQLLGQQAGYELLRELEERLAKSRALKRA